MSGRRLVSGANRNRGRPSSSSSHQQLRGPVELPEYETPTCPLDEGARRALTELSNNQDARKYGEQLNQSLKALENSVRDINDKYSQRKMNLKSLQEKRREKGVEKSEAERQMEQVVEKLRKEVPQLTKSSDLAVREIIDWKVELADGKRAMEITKERVQEAAAHAPPPPRPRGARRRRDRDGDNEDDEGEDGEMDDVDDDGPPVQIPGPLTFLKEERDKLAADYASKSLYERYGLDNDYIHFKGIWHDAEFGQEGKVLPDASRWFNEDGGGGGDEEDDDLIVQEEHIDLRCPLSLVEMSDPVTGRKCRHAFERVAIEEYLNGHPGNAAKCPQAGCDQMIHIRDLQTDELRARKIMRERQRRNQDDSIDEDDEEEADEAADVSMRMTAQRKIKRERGIRRGRSFNEIEDNEEDDEA